MSISSISTTAIQPPPPSSGFGNATPSPAATDNSFGSQLSGVSDNTPSTDASAAASAETTPSPAAYNTVAAASGSILRGSSVDIIT